MKKYTMVKNALSLPSRRPFPLICRIAIFLISGIFLLVGCTPRPPTPSHQLSPGSEKNSQSLLLSTPFIGEETTARNPAPLPVRVQLGDESVEGWLAPPEKVLRFPVDLKEGCKLSFRLGIVAGPYKPIFTPPPSPRLPVPPPGNGGAPAPPLGSVPPRAPEPPPIPPTNLPLALPEPADLFLKVEFAPAGQDGKPKGLPSQCMMIQVGSLMPGVLLGKLKSGKTRTFSERPKASRCPNIKVLLPSDEK